MAQSKFLVQTKALLWRNFLLKRRSKSQTIQEFFLPVMFMLYLALVQLGWNEAKVLPPVPQEQTFSRPLMLNQYPTILATPNSSEVEKIMEEVLKEVGGPLHTGEPGYILFTSEREMIQHYMNLTEDLTTATVGLIFNSLNPESVDYTIRTPAKTLPSLTEEIASPEYCRPQHFHYSISNCPAIGYSNSGFLELQNLINTAVARVLGNATLELPAIRLHSLPKFSFQPNTQALQGLTAILIIFAYSPFINFLLVNLVAEKEKKIRETMRIMGTMDSAYWFSWSIIYGIIITIVTIVCTILLKLTGVLARCDGFLLFLLLLFYGITIIHMAFALTPLFKKANVAGTVGTLATLVIGFLYLPINITSVTTLTGLPQTTLAPQWQWLLCLLSPIAIGLAVDKAQLLEMSHGGLNFDTIDVGEFPVYGSLVMLVLDCFIYGFIAWYLERVVPGEFGPRQDAFFCFSRKYWQPNYKKRHDCGEGDSLVTNAHGSNQAATVHNPKSDNEEVSPELKGKESVSATPAAAGATRQMTMEGYSSTHVVKAETMWVLRTVTSHQSYKSNEGIPGIFKYMFPDSDVAEKFSMSERKCAYVACFGLYPYFRTQFRRNLAGEPYVLLFDESLNKSVHEKQLDIQVRIWDHDTVVTRYFGSSFLGHATAELMLKSFKEDFDLNLGNVFQLSMDGPNVNWRFYQLLQEDIASETNRDCSMLNLGSCGLHVVHNAFKSGVSASSWDVSSVLGSLHYLFDEAPARREDYKSAGGSVFPLKFCNHRIYNITKKFKQQAAVDGLSLDIYEGHITCLLGHNGAGKTTLVNMLTGVMHPTSGTATVYGYDICDPNEVAAMRSMVGLCPQENCLFDILSCREHLEVYASMKGVPSTEIAQKVQSSLNDVGLSDKADTYSKDLSGGQKRKLSVAIALIGDPKVVFLDEPSAGLDPSSRRHLWSLLKSFKKDRIILLTTHFMDEADLLADRKAFMSKGKLQCCGSSLFLKNRFGIGYHLTMVIDNNANVDGITKEVASHVPQAKFVRRYGQELLFTLPFQAVGNFAGLFAKFESSSDGDDQVDFSTTLGIQSYGVSMTSLEEVFMKLEEAEEAKEGGVLSPTDVIVDLQSYPEVRFSDKAAKGKSLLSDSPAVLDPSAVEMKEIGKGPMMPQIEEGESSTAMEKFVALGHLRVIQMWRNKRNIFYRILLPAFFVLLGAVFPKFMSSPDPSSDLKHKVAPYWYVKNSGDMTLPPLVQQNLTGGSLDDLLNEIKAQGFEYMMVNNSANFSLMAPKHMGVAVLDFKGEAEGYFLNYTALFNDTIVHSMPAILDLIGNALYRLTTQTSWKIETTAMMWPNLEAERTYRYDGGTIMTVFLWGIAMLIIPPGFSGEVAKDRVSKARSQLRISGLRWGTYWSTYFLTHISQFSICAVLTIIIAIIIQVDSLKTSGALLCLFLLYVIYMPTLTLLSYILAFPMKKQETALTVVSNIYLFCAVIPFLIVMLLTATTNSGDIAHVILCFIDPPYAIYGGLAHLELTFLRRVTQSFMMGAGNEPPDISLGEYLQWENNILVVLIAGIVQMIVFFILLMVLDVYSTGGSMSDVFPFIKSEKPPRPTKNTDLPPAEDCDVTSERQKVDGIDPKSQEKPPIVLNNVRKQYKKRRHGFCSCCRGLISAKTPAVRNVSLAVEKGEVFGLLGPNGAGKTTTLNMILAETAPDTGRVYVGSHDIRSSLSEAFQALGYCPQHDPLWDDVTLEEHIHCYAIIRGIPKDKVEPLTRYFLESLKLEEHAKKVAKALSGGTKRKLCYILSMLGNPQIVLMDEPSTGMDPKSKRFLWNTISETFAGSNKGAILTTHYMDEADVLCSRVGIMVNGLLQCLGSTQHLKNKYGSGYILEIKIDASVPTRLEESMEKVHGFVMEYFPHAVLAEGFGNMSTYKILKDDITSLAKVFAALEEGKVSLGIEEYSFSQSTLEQVFLSFAKNQLILDEEPVPAGTFTTTA